jgi:hypothetical protein
MWEVSPATQPPLRKVVTWFSGDSVTMRHAAEDRLATALITQGVSATPGYAVLGDRPMDLDTVKANLRQQGYDGIVTMRIIDREYQIETTPSTIDGYWGYWPYPAYGWGYSGYTYTTTIYRVETAAYALTNDRLVWSAITKTVDPSNSGDLIGKTSKIVASRLTHSGLAG